jgi:predicted nucleotidyltransferase
MPTRSLTSSVLRWPSRAAVDAEVRRWLHRIAERRPDLMRLGVFGSYARGDDGVGSDLDLVAIVRASNVGPLDRVRGWDTTSLPVPVDLLVFTEEEWARVRSRGRFADVLATEARWLYERGSEPSEQAKAH